MQVEKIELAEKIIFWLNANGHTMFYSDLGKIIGVIPVAVGKDILDAVNLRHKAQGGDTVITDCIINKATGEPGKGIETLTTVHGMKQKKKK